MPVNVRIDGRFAATVLGMAICLLTGSSEVALAAEADSAHKDGLKVSETAAALPAVRTDNNWMDKHVALVERARKGGIETLFLGDSITEWMNRDLLKKYFGQRAENFGIAGDRTQHLLWRLQNGELDIKGENPRIVVMLIGTNNLGPWINTPASTNEEIVQGIRKNLYEIKKRLPASKILLLGILPRDEKPRTDYRQRIIAINEKCKSLADNKQVFYADIGPSLLLPDGRMSPKVMKDFLHPNHDSGYDVMFKAIKTQTNSILQNSSKNRG